MPCPHCKQQALIRTSAQMSPLLRELRYVCRNDECGHTFVAYAEISYTLSPSAMPDPSINLPFSQHVKRSELIGQLTLAPQAQPLTATGEVSQDKQGTVPMVDMADMVLTSEQVLQRVRHLLQAYQIAKTLGTFPAPVDPGARPLQWRETDVQHWVNQQHSPLQAQP